MRDYSFTSIALTRVGGGGGALCVDSWGLNESTKKPKIEQDRWNFHQIGSAFVLNIFLKESITTCVKFYKTSQVLFWLGVKWYCLHLKLQSSPFAEETNFTCGPTVSMNCMFWRRLSFVARWIYWLRCLFNTFFNI